MNPEAVRSRLQAQMLSVAERRARLARHVEHRDEALPADSEEQALELENAETMTALSARLEVEALELQRALSRLDSGEYGRCEVCGEPIDERRLDALPTAGRCIACAV